VRTRVHEYGGAAASVRGGWAYYSDFADGRVYRVKTNGDGEEAKAVTEGMTLDHPSSSFS